MYPAATRLGTNVVGSADRLVPLPRHDPGPLARSRALTAAYRRPP